MRDPLLQITNLKVEFPTRRGLVTAARDIHLTLRRGEVLGVVGESGAGKSTIGNAVIGLLEPPGRIAAGSIRLQGQELVGLPAAPMRRIRGRRIGMIFQDPLTSLNPLFTIEAQLIETIRLHTDLSEAAARRRAIDLIDRVGIPDPAGRVKQFPHQFSGGMRQRVVIALALAGDPELIIADEPTTALDVSIQAQILDLLRGLCRERRVGIIIITHDMGVIADVTDRVAVMYHGRTVEEGTTDQILGRPGHAYTRSLIAAVPRPDRKVHRFPLVTYSDGEAINGTLEARRPIDVKTHWLGRPNPAATAMAADMPAETPMVRVSDLSIDFQTRPSIIPGGRRWLRAVDGVSFAIRPGEVFGIVGESGSGKSTIARMIAGLYRPTAGRIEVAGTDLTAIRSERALRPHRRQMQMIFQDPYSSLNPRLRVLDIVAEPIRFHRLATSAAEEKAIVGDLLEHVGLGRAAAGRFPHAFSGGQRQRISIARALATRPRFLICDEPTSALDVSVQAQILNLLKDLQEQLSLTMMFISHDLPVIRQMCDRVAVMRGGRLCELAPTEDLFTDPQHDYSRHLLGLMPKLDGLAVA